MTGEVRPLLIWCRGAARVLMASLHNGLLHLGATMAPLPPGTPVRPDDLRALGPLTTTEAGTGPGPGHPEHLCPGVPLTRAEEQIWRHLGFRP